MKNLGDILALTYKSGKGKAKEIIDIGGLILANEQSQEESIGR